MADFLTGFVWEDQAPLMRQLPVNLGVLLCTSGWQCPFLLNTGFDTELEAYTLVAGLPGNTETAATNRRFARILMAWSSRNASTIQRLRKRAASSDPYQQAVTLQEFRQRHSSRPTPFIPSVTKVLFRTNHWRNRRERRKAKADCLDSRRLIEEEEKARWVKHVVNVLKEAKVPVCDQASLASDPDLALSAVVGSRRSRTLRNRCRMFWKISVWLVCVFQQCWPTNIGQMLDFLRDVELGPCPKSLPANIAGALAFFESISGIPESLQIHKMQLWKSNVSELEMRVQGKGDNTIVHKALCLPIVALISLELFVVSDQPDYWRFLSFCVLLMTWMSLRFDDLLGLSVSRLALTKTYLRGVLTRTKTTGPGKRILEVPTYLNREASFTGCAWVKVGYDLLQKEAFSYLRDYFLPQPSFDFLGTRKGLLTYSQASGLYRQLLGKLHTVGRDESGLWQEGSAYLFEGDSPLFWTLHGPRHFVPSVAAAESISKDVRDMAGRWGISSQQSGEYVLTARTVITGLQATLMTRLCSQAPTYDEDELKAEYWTWLRNRQPSLDHLPAIHRICINVDKVESAALNQQWPVVRSVGEAVVVDVETNAPLEAADLLAEEASQRLEPKPEEIYWVSIGKSGFRRLHRVDGCRTSKTDCWKFLTSESALSEKSDRPCLLCWPNLRGKLGEPSEDSQDSDGSSSSSSDEEDTPAVAIAVAAAASAAAAAGPPVVDDAILGEMESTD